MLPEINAELGKKSKGVGQRPQKRRYSLEYKLQVVRETLAPGASVSLVARRHDINSNVVFCWRKRFREGAAGNGTARGDLNANEAGFIPIHVVDGEAAMRALPTPERPRVGINRAPAGKPAGLIEIVMPGGVVVRVDAHVDDLMLRRVLTVIRALS